MLLLPWVFGLKKAMSFFAKMLKKAWDSHLPEIGKKLFKRCRPVFKILITLQWIEISKSYFYHIKIQHKWTPFSFQLVLVLMPSTPRVLVDQLPPLSGGIHGSTTPRGVDNRGLGEPGDHTWVASTRTGHQTTRGLECLTSQVKHFDNICKKNSDARRSGTGESRFLRPKPTDLDPLFSDSSDSDYSHIYGRLPIPTRSGVRKFPTKPLFLR